MYLEGSDQHRGWFQSSLLVALGTRGRPPFREVLTHGFLIDLDGRKMSKSLGNTIAPQEVIKESGAEILRLWVAMSDFTRGAARQQGDPRARRRGLPQAAEHAAVSSSPNLYDFDPAADRVPLDAARRGRSLRAGPIRRRWRERIVRGYDDVRLPDVFQALNTLATVDLSAFYGDVTKDRLYTFAARSHERRSTQTAMYLMCDGLARLLAPILPVTADELWRTCRAHARDPCTSAFPDRRRSSSRWRRASWLERWEQLLESASR